MSVSKIQIRVCEHVLPQDDVLCVCVWHDPTPGQTPPPPPQKTFSYPIGSGDIP
jgi:hypothetical protein